MSISTRDKANWMIHLLYIRGETDECLQLIENQLRMYNALCEYPLYIKGVIFRQQGNITKALQFFQAATALNPTNIINLKAVARCLFLLGRFRPALDVYQETERILQQKMENSTNVDNSSEDWEIYYNKGQCYQSMKLYRDAEDCYLKANDIMRHDSTYIALGKLYVLQENYYKAINVTLEALEHTPENSELLTFIGLLYLRMGDSYKAFEYLGNSLTHDPKNSKTILATGSVIQDHGDADVALAKYRIAAVQTPNSAPLWNNIGMAFFSKQKYIAAIACLKRALYLEPFEWIMAYNLGLVHIRTEQYASAYHYLSTCIQLKPNFAQAYAYLGLALSRLEDFTNACGAYEKVGFFILFFFLLFFSSVAFGHGEMIPRLRISFVMHHSVSRPLPYRTSVFSASCQTL